MTATTTPLEELQLLLNRARTLHTHLCASLQDRTGLDRSDIVARYGDFSSGAGATTTSATKRRKLRKPELMIGTEISPLEKRKIRLLLHALRSSNDGGGEDGGGGGGADLSGGGGGAPQAASSSSSYLPDLRGLTRQSLQLFERLALRVADVEDSDAGEDSDDFDDAASSTTATSAASSRALADGDADGERSNDNDENGEGGDGEVPTRSAGCQTAETTVQSVKMAQRILAGESEESFGGLRSRRFPHRVPRPPVARGAYRPKAGVGADADAQSSGGEIAAGHTYTAIAFRPQSLKQLQQQGGGGDGGGAEGVENSAGWTPAFFPVEIVFAPGLSAAAAAANAGGGGDGTGGTLGGVGGAAAAAGAATIAGSSSGTVDSEGGARLIIRRIPITRDGQRYAASRSDAAQSQIADVGCGAVRAVVVGQTTRFFLRGRMVLQKKPEWAKRWEWRVPPALALHHHHQAPAAAASSPAQSGNNRIPPVVDFTTLPSMAQMADRCVSLAFVDATVLNLPAKSPDVEEDAALQAAAAKASRLMTSAAAQEGADADHDGPAPLHVSTAPANYLPSAGAELALAFPSHAEFNCFLAEAMHWCADFAAFRYGRPADFHSREVLKGLPPQVRESWQALDDEEITFCEEFHVPPSVYLTARRRVIASQDPKAMTPYDGLLCEEDISTICDVDYLQLSAMLRFLQARGFVKLHSLFYVRKCV